MENHKEYIGSELEKHINPSDSFIFIDNEDVSESDMEYHDHVIYLEKINSVKSANAFHEKINKGISEQSFYICCYEANIKRQIRIRNNTIFGLKNIFLFTDFIIHRVFPKLPLIKRVYFILSSSNNRCLSKAEMYGRLISCGFEITDTFEHEGLFYVVSKKISNPKDDLDASYGLLFKMKKIGLNQKTIYLYKFRTMSPYSEYLQSVLYKQGKLGGKGDKIDNDFRLTSWGKFLRKYWIDELPQLYNLIKGDIGIVGIRALSEAKFQLYDDDLKEMRTKVKPGLIPPYYADMPENFTELQNSERNYINKKLSSPISTDFKYFFRALNNIVFKGARSE